MQQKTTPPRIKSYSESFKRKVVREYERGHVTKDYLKSKYNIGGKSTVLKWCRKYGRFEYSKNYTTGRPMKDAEKQRIKILERQLKEAREKLIVYEKLIDVTKRESGIDILKNIDTKLSGNCQQAKKK